MAVVATAVEGEAQRGQQQAPWILIVHGSVPQHGGTLCVESGLGVGTTLPITLPLG